MQKSKEQYQAERAAKVQDLMDQLEAGVKAVFESDNYRDYLNVMSRFHHYSFRNSILIWLQKPDATQVAGYTDWQRNFKRQVRKGEKGIRIFAPVLKRREDDDGNKEDEIVCCKVVSVFDVSQTEGEDLPTLGVDELTGDVAQYGILYDALTHVSPVPMAFEDMPADCHGYYNPAELRIAIRDGMSELQTVKTAIHEIAHATLHALPADGKRPKDGPDRSTREVQAESVAYIVCQHYGLDTSDYSFGYVAGWSSERDAPELTASMDTIRQAAHTLIDAIDAAMAA